jgi:beta-lactamase class A
MDRREFLAGTPALLLAGRADAAPALRGSIEQIERTSGGRLGLAVLDSASGRRFEWRGDALFPMCSTFKLLLAAAVLERADRGRESLARVVPIAKSDLLDNSPFGRSRIGHGATLGELCEAIIVDSDNAGANLLLSAIGGPPGLTRFARRLGDKVTRLDRNELSLGEARPGDPRDTTSPKAMLADMDLLLTGALLSPQSRRRLIGWLIACRTGKARLRAGFPPDWRIGDKTGSGANGTTNDIAIAWRAREAEPLLVAAYLTGSTLEAAAREAILAAVGRAVTIWATKSSR